MPYAGSYRCCITVLDVLGYLDEIPVCTGYEIDGKVTTEFPTTGLLEKAKPVFEVLPGWKSDIRELRTMMNFRKIAVSISNL